MFAILCPGQGAQSSGMLAPWVRVPGVAERLTWWSAVTGLDLVELGTTAPEETVRDTAVAQPLLVATALAVAAEVLDAPDPAGVTAGHSVGELAAAVLAGALSAETALVLVRERGTAMAAAAASAPTGMSAVLGGDPDEVDARLVELELTAANRNGAGQVVAAGRRGALERLAADPPGRARVRPLSVAGAFHTDVMAPARDRLAGIAAGVPVRDPRMRLLSNADGAVVTSGRDLLDRLVAQVAAPVRFDLCLAALGELGVTAVIELPPAGTLTGLVRRVLPGVETLAVKAPEDLATARSLLASHESPVAHPLAWRVVISPVGGTFHRESLLPGEPVGATIGVVGNARVEQKVEAVHGGVLVEWLAEDGDPVVAGQPLARLHPEAHP